MSVDVPVFIGQLTHIQSAAGHRCGWTQRAPSDSFMADGDNCESARTMKKCKFIMPESSLRKLSKYLLVTGAEMSECGVWDKPWKLERGSGAFPKWFISCCRWRSSSSHLAGISELLERSHALMISLVMKDGIMKFHCYGIPSSLRLCIPHPCHQLSRQPCTMTSKWTLIIKFTYSM